MAKVSYSILISNRLLEVLYAVFAADDYFGRYFSSTIFGIEIGTQLFLGQSRLLGMVKFNHVFGNQCRLYFILPCRFSEDASTRLEKSNVLCTEIWWLARVEFWWLFIWNIHLEFSSTILKIWRHLRVSHCICKSWWKLDILSTS